VFSKNLRNGGFLRADGNRKHLISFEVNYSVCAVYLIGRARTSTWHCVGATLKF